MFFTVVLVQVLLASCSFATPASKEWLARRHEQRTTHRAGPLQHSTSGISEPIPGVTAPFNNPTWAGAAFLNYPNGTFSGVKGIFTVPTLSTPDGGSGSYFGAAWVGIDGAACQSAIWQTGIEFVLDGDEVAYTGWYEWWPNVPVFFNTSELSFNPGDEVALTITVESPTSGTSLIENLTNGQKAGEKFVNATFPLCQQNAEWIVEDFEGAPFANFSSIVFTNTSATTSFGTVGPRTATPCEIVQNNVSLTAASTTYDSVIVSRI